MKNLFKNNTLLFYLSVTFLIFMIILLRQAFFLKIPLGFIFTTYFKDFCYTDTNIFLSGHLAGLSINYFYYILAFLSTFFIVLFQKRISKNSQKNTFTILLSISLIVCFFYTIGQSYYQTNMLMNDRHNLKGKTFPERVHNLNGDVYLFALNCSKNLPGTHNATLITDLNYQGIDMFYHRRLAYFLYPIDIREIRDGQKDCLIIYEKENAIKHVPQDYKIIYKHNDKSLLAYKNYQ